MCGIIGSFNKPGNLNDSEMKFKKSLDLLNHRGPDFQNSISYVTSTGNVRLGHTRLSIIDLSDGGNQPMKSSNGRFVITFNGEIYNYKELRQDLINLGYKFSSDSDSEVLVEAWAEWGSKVLNRLTGMFAFAIYDKLNSTITLVRDAFGIKPLYYSNSSEGFYFASELQPLINLIGVKQVLNQQRIHDYIVNAVQDTGDKTFIKDINHLPPAHIIKINLNDPINSFTENWWKPKISTTQNITFKNAVKNLRELFLESIKLHLRSDVPLGIALSGGIDSSAIACCVKYLEPKTDIHTFSYIPNDNKLSEEPFIDIINNHIKAIPHKIYVNSNELKRDIKDLISTQGEPFCTTSIYAQYRIFRAAKEAGIKVVLEGQGADELLAGYHGYQGQRMRSLFEEGNYLGMIKFSNEWSKWPGREKLSTWRAFIGQLLPDKLYDFAENLLHLNPKLNLLDRSSISDLGINTMPFRLKRNSHLKGRRVVEALSQAVSSGSLPSLLRYGDRNAMRFSIENRVPFLTLPIAEFLLSLPEEFLIASNGETKSIFRAAMRGIVPDVILDRRDKIGFETPMGDLISSLTKNLKLTKSFHNEIGILEYEKTKEHLNKLSISSNLATAQDWRIVNLNLWTDNLFK